MKLSIITATRNCAATVAECMTSILRQTHPDIEQIFIDGASTDNTLEVISRVMPYPAPLRLHSEGRWCQTYTMVVSNLHY